MITSLTRLPPVYFARPRMLSASTFGFREMTSISGGKHHHGGHHHHHKGGHNHNHHSHGFMMTCSCGIGSSPADHDHLHAPFEKNTSVPSWLQSAHSWTDKVHENIPLGVISVSAALLASFGTPFVPLLLLKSLVLGVFSVIGIPSIIHLATAVISSERKIRTILDVHSLMTLSAFAALAIGQGAEGAFLLALFQLAHAIQHRVVQRAKKDVNRLADLVPDTVQVISGDGQVEAMDSHSVSIGSLILVRPGNVFPIDGTLTKPVSVAVQLAHLTGEAATVEKNTGDSIPAGAVNVSTVAVQIETTRTASQSTLQRIVDLAQSAARSRPKVASWISEVAPMYSSAVLAGTASIAVTGPMFFGWTISAAVYKALSFLVAASPCALLVASPVAQAAAVSACSRKGIILSGGAQALERFATAECIAMDKTGTMTEGRMHVSHVEPIAGNTDLCLELGAVLGQFGSGHPVAQGIAQRLKTRVASYRIVPLTVKEVPGLSVSGSVFDPDQNKEYFVTIAKYAPDVQAGLVRYGSTSRISVTSADASELHDCVVSLEDKVRPGVRDAVARCKLPILMLTGDNERNAFKVASDIGIDYSKVFSQLSPQEKAHIVSKKLGNAVMVGDGVNDAPALAAAKAGGVAVAGSAASDSIQSAAVSVADAVIVADDRSNPVDSVSFLVEKSKQTSSLIKSNVGIAIAGIMGTAIAVMIANCPLWLAVLVHEGSTVLVVLNSLRNL